MTDFHEADIKTDIYKNRETEPFPVFTLQKDMLDKLYFSQIVCIFVSGWNARACLKIATSYGTEQLLFPRH